MYLRYLPEGSAQITAFLSFGSLPPWPEPSPGGDRSGYSPWLVGLVARTPPSLEIAEAAEFVRSIFSSRAPLASRGIAHGLSRARGALFHALSRAAVKVRASVGVDECVLPPPAPLSDLPRSRARGKAARASARRFLSREEVRLPPPLLGRVPRCSVPALRALGLSPPPALCCERLDHSTFALFRSLQVLGIGVHGTVVTAS